jgi:hypothetical protein
MPGFTRRYLSFPPVDTITLIEGIIIVDLPPPGQVQGTGTGTCALIGEFADMTHAVLVDGSGNVTTKTNPVEAYSPQDMLGKVGGFDETLGEFGVSGGNGIAALRNKKFSRLILVPVNLCSSKAVRLVRDLPTNLDATHAIPVVPMQAAGVSAGREFRTGANRVRIGAKVSFTGLGAYASGVDGAVTAAGSTAEHQLFTSAGAAFTTVVRPDGTTGVQVGDVLVLGVIGGAGALGANADTYRVQAVSSATTLQVERQDGTMFDWTTGTAQPWRVHPGSDADTAPVGANLAAAGGYTVPARPLDATITAATIVQPTVAPPANAASSWDPLSGLALACSPGATDLIYTAAVQAPNVVSSASTDALYAGAFDALLTTDQPGSDVNIVWPARTSATIRAKQKAHVLAASAQGFGRITIISPPINTLVSAESTILSSADPGVGANRDERVIYSWPGLQTFVPEAVGFSLKNALGTSNNDGLLDDRADGWLASILSLLAPERNPGQGTSPVTDVMAAVLGFQRGVSGLAIGDYIAFRSQGICAPIFDRASGYVFQSGITTSLTSGKKNINRRRMADYIEDSLSTAFQPYVKQPLTDSVKDSIVGEAVAFLTQLQSPNNAAAQRIVGYIVDDKSGNTPDLEAQGIFVVIVKVRTLATADFIVLQCEIGEGVNITQG